MSFFPFSTYFGSCLNNDKYVYFQKILIHTYIEEDETSVMAEYFSTENLGNLKKLGVSQIQLSEKFRHPRLLDFTVTSNTELAILAPYLLICDSTNSEFRLWQLGDHETIWDINLSKSIDFDASFCGVVIMDGPVIAFVYQNASMASGDNFASFEENNTYIILWRPLLQRNVLCSLVLLAHNIQGFWLPHQQVNDVDEPYILINVIYRPLYESCIIMRNFFENFSPPIPFFNSTIPDYYMRNITCLLRTWNNEEIVWMGTSQRKILCIKNADGIGDVKPVWCTDVTSIPLKLEEVQLDKRVEGVESVLIIYLENGLIIVNSESGKKLREFPNETILLFGDFYQCGYQNIVQVLRRLNSSFISCNEILINNINEENVDSNLHIQEGNISHLSSLLDSLSTRIYDGTAQTRKIEEMINQKYKLLKHSDSLLQPFSCLIGLYYLKRVRLTKQVSQCSKHTEGLIPLIPLIPGTRVLTKDLVKKIYTNQDDEPFCIEVMKTKTSVEKFNHNENILIEISVRNRSFQDLYTVHLVIYIKSTSGLISSMLKSNSSYINLLHIEETRTIFSSIYLPLDLVSDYLEFGAFILYYRTADEMDCETLCVKKIKKARMANQDFDHLLPSTTYLIFTTTNSLNQQWNIYMLPFLLEQYLGVISKENSESDLSKNYKPLDGLSWIKIFRSYKCSVNEVDQISCATKQIMAMHGQNDSYLIKMLLNLLKELHEVSLPLPLLTSTQALNGLNDVLYILEHLITARSNFESKRRKNGTINRNLELPEKLRRELCITASYWLCNL